MNTGVFDKCYDEYNNWFKKNKYAYLTELEAIKHFYTGERNVEIGIGSGKFAVPLNIKFGIDPSESMMKTIPQDSKIKTVRAVAEKIPFDSNSFENALMVTTICFVKDAEESLKEIHRILKKKGKIIIGFVDKESELGKQYAKTKSKSKFYKSAEFYSTGEIVELLIKTKFKNIRIIQTLFGDYKKIKSIQEFKNGFGEGNFAVICGEKNGY
ncbi:MAG TPA: class I SAM-dependent methyltransferase [bacterium]|nr:class I SAM-dependent methyltransferase [bacterium]HPN30168.1 class I SAM-dependent methyltransferase [bacterium]